MHSDEVTDAGKEEILKKVTEEIRSAKPFMAGPVTFERLPFAECVVYGLAKTILEIAERMKKQDADVLMGVKYVKPPTLSDFARELRIAVSAVSMGGWEAK